MPRFCRFLCGPRVTVRPQVISGPASPGQHVWTGSRARSTSSPSHTMSWHGADAALLRRHVEHLHEHRPRVAPGVDEALRRLGLLQEREQPADVAQRRLPVAGSAPIAARRARGVPNRLPSTGIVAPLGPRNRRRILEQQRRAAARATRDRRAPSSRAADRPRRATRFSSPSASSCAMKSRRSR